MRTWIKNPLVVWTGSASIAAAGIVVDQDTIVELVAEGEAPSVAPDQEFDADGLVVTPGLINTHHHFYQTLTRAHPGALDKALFPWLRALYPVWANLTEDDIALSTELAVAELMLSGCTTTVDHHYLFTDALANAIDVQVEVTARSGMRTVLTRGSMSLGQSAGGLPPDRVVQSEDDILDDSERLIDKYHDPRPGAMTRVALAPCSPFSVSSELMRDSAELARRHGCLLHTHLAETEDEGEYCKSRFGKRPVELLDDLGWLADDVWVAHGIHFTNEEIARLGAAGVGISHCPNSNMVLSSGVCPTLELEAAGAPIGLGVDGSASNDANNMIQEVRQAFLLQRLHFGAERVSHEHALRWGTMGGAELLRRADIGQIVVGARADLALFDLDEDRFSGSGDPVAALVLCGAHRVSHLMVDGKWRVRDRRLLDADVGALRDAHRRAARRLIAA